MKKAWWSSGSGRIELQIPEQAIGDCSHSGQCDADVDRWLDSVDWSHISTDIIALELKEYGAWDDLQTVDRRTLQARLFWIACGDLADSNEREYVEEPNPMPHAHTPGPWIVSNEKRFGFNILDECDEKWLCSYMPIVLDAVECSLTNEKR